jgi:hypothetical protein
MKRWTLAALAAATLISATAIAGTLAQVEIRTDTTHQTAASRWRAAEASESGTVAEYVPSVNFQLDGQAGGAFVLP